MRRLATALAAAVLVAGVLVVWYGAPAHADEVRDAQWHLDALAVEQAHEHSLGDGVTVAVLDSGVDASHPDLRENVLPGADLTGRGSDGRDDPGGSGTALAGLVAGHGHPGPGTDEPGTGVAPDGVLGLAPRAAILPVVVAEPGASPEARTLAAGVTEAVRLGADVICIGRPVPDDPLVTRALGAALAAGTLLVVPGLTSGDALARFHGAGLLPAEPAQTLQQTGPGAVAVPAAGVMSTGSQGGYYRYARTAEAAAAGVLAGAAALVRAAHPALPGFQAAHRIAATTDGGALQLVDALTAAVDPAPDPPPEPAPEPPGPAAPGPTHPSAPDEPPGAEPDRAAPVAAFDSGDLRRWLVAVPLLAFLGAATLLSVRTARRPRG